MTPAHWFDEQLRNRALALLALLALCPLALQLVDVPARIISTSALGSALSVRVSVDTLLITLLPALTCVGADWILRYHPDVQQGEIQLLFPYWVAPAFAAVALAIMLTRINTWPLWILVLIAGVFAIGSILLSEWLSLSPSTPGYTLARLMLTAGVYATAFTLFTLIYAGRERSLVSATLVALVALGLSFDLLSPQIIGLTSALAQGGAIALMMGQAMWAMNYWNIGIWSAGIVLLTLFYVLVGLAQQHVQDRLTRTVLIEFGVIAAFALALAFVLVGVR